MPGLTTLTRDGRSLSMATISWRDDSDNVTTRVSRYSGGATRRSMNSPTPGVPRAQDHLPHLGVHVMEEDDAGAPGPQRREEGHAVPDLDQPVGPASRPKEPAEGAAGEDACGASPFRTTSIAVALDLRLDARAPPRSAR